MKNFLISICTFLVLSGCSSENLSLVKQNNTPTSSEIKTEEWQVSPSFTIPKQGPNGNDVPYGLLDAYIEDNLFGSIIIEAQ